MNSLTAGVTGSAPSDTSSHTQAAVRGGNKRPRSRHLSRCATIYLQINKELIRGVEGSPARKPLVQNSSIHKNLKQFSKVGFEEAKTWMERRLAGMKNGIPAADAASLSQGWLSSVDSNTLLGMDPGIAAIEAANLAKQYARWHVPCIGHMEQTRPDGVFRIMGGQLNSASSLEVRARKTSNIIRLINDWEVQGGCLSEVGIDWSIHSPLANLASWFHLEIQDIRSHTAHNKHKQDIAHHQPGETATVACKELARYVKQKGNDFRGLGR
jgi:hypothetical protein